MTYLPVLLAVSLASTQTAPIKNVKQAESQLERLLENGDDRPSVYAARLELVRALRSLGSCAVNDRVDAELAVVAGWIERTGIATRFSPQLVYNELGRAAQTRALCTEDPAAQLSFHAAARREFARAAAAAERDHDPLNQAVTLFNAAASAEAQGDMTQAIALMEKACAIDREFGLFENYREDYREMVRMKDAYTGIPTPPETIERHLEGLVKEKVALAFKPANGEKQSYRTATKQVAFVDGKREERSLEVQYASATTVKDDLVTIAIEPQAPVIKGGGSGADDLVAQLVAQPMSYTVTTGGEFVGATGLDQVRQLALKRIDDAFAGTAKAEDRERARQLLDQLLSKEVIHQQLAAEWTMSVGWWVGAELDLGDWYELDVDAPQALMPGATLRYHYMFKVNRRLPCTPDDRKASCVELILEGRPEREPFADFLIGFMKQVVGKLPKKEVRWFRERLVEDLDLVERHVLVVEPGTLKAFRQTKSKATYVASAERGGQPKIELRTTESELQVAAKRSASTKSR